MDKRLGGIIMTSDDGKRLAWRFEKGVIEQASAFHPGDPIVVIYRQTGGDKTVTAVAFPGATTTPVYMNTTGERVEFVSGPAAADGVCGRSHLRRGAQRIDHAGRWHGRGLGRVLVLRARGGDLHTREQDRPRQGVPRPLLEVGPGRTHGSAGVPASTSTHTGR